MTLAAYLRAHRLNQTGFARLLGVSPSMVSHWLAGHSPSARWMLAIYRVTSGEVTPNDLVLTETICATMAPLARRREARPGRHGSAHARVVRAAC
jgi:DNA-binding transcriptional regulator YdaS (Cro superfamily)